MWSTGWWNAPRLLLCALFAVGLLAAAVQGDEEVPSEVQCRPYVEKALKELEAGDAHSGSDEDDGSKEATDVDDDKSGEPPDGSDENDQGNADVQNDDDDSKEGDDATSVEVADEPYTGDDTEDDNYDNSKENKKGEDDSKEDQDSDSKEGDSKEKDDDDVDSKEEAEGEKTDTDDDDNKTDEKDDSNENDDEKAGDSGETQDDDSKEDEAETADDGDDDNDTAEGESVEEKEISKESIEELGTDNDDSKDDDKDDSGEDSKAVGEDDSGDKDDQESTETKDDSKEDDDDSKEDTADKTVDDSKEGDSKEDSKVDDSKEDSKDDSKEDSKEDAVDDNGKSDEKDADDDADTDDDGDDDDDDSDEDGDEIPEEDLLKEQSVPANLKSRDHIVQILRLDQESSENEVVIERSADIILRDLKRIYENNIKPLEVVYKYRDLSNRHFGDPEIFSKPLLLLMGPWSGGKSSIINYLTDIEFTEWSLRTGAEPSPAYFNILMHGKEPEVLDGTQLAADWTFSGLQKFGQGLEERLRGLKYPSKILEKMNIVEIPGILEVRKQVSRVFPFNDACQWFIDRADIIFLVYDPSKLDVGPETEAILDQLKGRESQVRIILNKADIVKPEELLRVQGALIWNISPLMSSAAPPALYAASLWARPLAPNAPSRLLAAQERALLTDLRFAVDRRIDNKIASARRFAVRVRNHAKMVDCYLTTYYNHKTIFGNKKMIAEAIIEHPQNYHIYEGLSTLTNISRYDLPDPESYRDFFRLNPLYDFQPLSSTCTYFRGCPINRLDIAIAYDLPELVGKYKKMVESAVPQGMPKT